MDDGLLPVTLGHRRALTDRLSDILGKDGEKRKKLIEIYQKIQDFFHTYPDKILKEKTSVLYNNFQTQLENYAKDLMQEERFIVVAGETGAGKSTVLNLLLGINVLPTSLLPCTGVICHLRNSKTKKADIIDFNEKIFRTIEMEDNDEKKFTEDLRGCIGAMEQRVEHQIKCVDIYWPIPFLTEKIIVVDTPCIDSSEDVIEPLIPYLMNAVAIIYVVDVSRSSINFRDTILRLFEAIQGQHTSGKIQAFDPSCAVFLCNKWDLTGDDEDQVWRYIKNMLEIYWSNIQEKQIYRFSAKKTLKVIKKGKALPDEFIKFRRGFEELIEVSLGAKSRQHVFWLEKFLKTLWLNLTSQSPVVYLKHSKSKREEQINRVDELRKMLEDYNVCIISDQLKTTETETRALHEELRKQTILGQTLNKKLENMESENKTTQSILEVCEKENKSLKEELKIRKTSEESLQQKLGDLDCQLQSLKTIKSKCEELDQEKKDLQRQLEAKIETYESHIQLFYKLKLQYEELGKEQERLQADLHKQSAFYEFRMKELQSQNQQLHELKLKNEIIEEENKSLKREQDKICSSHETALYKIKVLKNQMENSKKFELQCEELEKENKAMRNRIEVMNIQEESLKRFKAKSEQFEKENKQLQRRLIEQTTVYGVSQDKIKDLESQVESLEHMPLHHKKKTDATHGALQDRLHQVELSTSTIEQARNKESSTRTSGTLAAQVPVDETYSELCDQIRPTKIAEHYMQLHREEWEDAFAELLDDGWNERDAINSLLDILLEANTFCKQQCEKMTDIGKYFEESLNDNSGLQTDPVLRMPVECENLAKDLLRQASVVLADKIVKKFMKAQIQRFGPHTEMFYRKCANVTWFMNVLTPPLELVMQRAGNNEIDTENFTLYSKTGSIIDFLVWPACKLHDDCLAKGVVQPLSSENGNC